MNTDPIDNEPLNNGQNHTERPHSRSIWSIIMNLIKRFFAWLKSLFA